MSDSEDRKSLEEVVIDRFDENKLRGIPDDELEDLREQYAEIYEQVGREGMAFAKVFSDYNFDKHVANSDIVRVNAIGANGPRPFGGQDALFLYGAAVPEDEQMGAVVILILEEDTEEYTLTELSEMFSEFGEPFDIDLDIRPADVVADAYIGEIPEGSTAGDVIERADPEDVSSEGERVNRIKQVTEEADIIHIGSNLSMQDEGYPADFGVDLKRIEPCSITSSQVSAKGSRYELQDDSFLNAEQALDESIIGTEDKAAGLVGWAEPQVMALETGSMLDSLYGTVDVNDEGRVEISIVGYNPEAVEEATVPADTDDSGGSGSGSTTSASGEAVEERTI
jgi:hypothetical protein